MNRQEKAIQRYIAERYFYSHPLDDATVNQIQPPFEFDKDGGYSYSEWTYADDDAVLSFWFVEKYRPAYPEKSYITIEGQSVTEFINDVCTLMEGFEDD